MKPGDLWIARRPGLRIWPVSPGQVSRNIEVGEKFILHSVRRNPNNPDEASVFLLDTCGNKWTTALYEFVTEAVLL